VASPADLIIKDNLGNIIASVDTSGNVVNSDTTKVSAYMINSPVDNLKFVHFLQENDTYNIELKGKDTGTIDVLVTQNKNGVQSIKYTNVPIQNNYTAKVEVGVNVTDDDLHVFDENNNEVNIVTDVHDDVIIPTQYRLLQNYPNPFNPTTTITYSIPVTSEVSIDIFNILGQKIKTLTEETKTIGQHSVIWDGTDNFGLPVSSGVYIYQLKTNDFVATNKMLYIK